MESAISTSHTGTMPAILQDSYGTPDVLRMGRVDMPTMGPKDVLVRVPRRASTAACGTFSRAGRT